ncbi:peroxin-10 [Kwoniella heveanensis CBS 569]|nr:peroxin-10 [Kwoniella heveanensis CBS 569]
MDQPIASSSRLPSPYPDEKTGDESGPYGSLSFQLASQEQILRSYQRDSAQVYRLTDLVSEVLRSIAGTRWLAHKQLIIDLMVKAVYLSLTFGRGSLTIGEEYTDILPLASRTRRKPSAKRRLATILFLIFPSILISPMTTNYLRAASTPFLEDTSSDPRSRLKRRLKGTLLHLLGSPFAKILPEVHMVAFLFSGRFFEFARRLTGVSYISTLPAKRPEQRSPSYEPLGLLMLLPILYRLFPRRTHGHGSDADPGFTASRGLGLPTPVKDDILPLSPPLTLPLSAEQTLLLSTSESYDTPNTYLTEDALQLAERQCTLCLEPRGTGEGSGGTVAVTECGHVFCWGCLGGLEKLECPLCRQALRMERLVAAYNL